MFGPKPSVAVNAALFQLSVIDAGNAFSHVSAFLPDVGIVGAVHGKIPGLSVRDRNFLFAKESIENSQS
jgi:hypothetical protein